jgi:hypothetical protein
VIMSNLRSQLERIADQFVSAIIAAMRTAPLSELAAQLGRASGPAAPATRRRAGGPAAAALSGQPAGRRRRKRASAAQVQKQKDTALATAKSLKPGFAKSDVMRKSGSKVDLGRALSLLVSDGKLIRKGDRRLARYWVK